MSPKSQEKQLPLNKHSKPFYISVHSLCHNKHLKLKRCRWLETLKHKKHLNIYTRSKKFNELTPSPVETIDLLSDDDEPNKTKTSNLLNDYYNFIPHLNETAMSTMNTTNVLDFKRTKVLETTPPAPLPPTLPVLSAPVAISNAKIPGKRKSCKPRKRRENPAVVLEPNESIILSDDDDVLLPDLEVISPCLEEHKSPDPQQLMQPRNSIQVDEVTVSLVPRAPSNVCTSQLSRLRALSNHHDCPTEAFPMLPDETTVQTVIANRTYELSLSKLREGLASCGIPEFAESPQKHVVPKRKSMAIPPLATPPQQPISLKLSSDLSISLISDDDDEEQTQSSGGDALLSPAILQKLPLNVSIAPVPKAALRNVLRKNAKLAN